MIRKSSGSTGSHQVAADKVQEASESDSGGLCPLGHELRTVPWRPLCTWMSGAQCPLAQAAVPSPRVQSGPQPHSTIRICSAAPCVDADSDPDPRVLGDFVENMLEPQLLRRSVCLHLSNGAGTKSAARGTHGRGERGAVRNGTVRNGAAQRERGVRGVGWGGGGGLTEGTAFNNMFKFHCHSNHKQVKCTGGGSETGSRSEIQNVVASFISVFTNFRHEDMSVKHHNTLI